MFADVDNTMRVARDDEAVALANDSDFGLAGSVWTADVDRGAAVAGRVRTGTIGVNHSGPDFGSPFGGFKSSGRGREHGPEGLDEFTELQSLALPS